MKKCIPLLFAFMMMAIPPVLCQGQDEIQYSFDVESQVYALGEEATITIAVYDNKELLTTGNLVVKMTNDGRDQIGDVQSFDLAMENPVVVKGKMEQPGFLQISSVAKSEDESKNVSKLAGVGFSPEKIEPGLPEPDDFEEFWSKGREEVRELPLDLEQTRLDDLCNDKHDVFSVSFSTVNDRRVFGFLSVPKTGEAPYPAIVNVPGAGPGVGPEIWLADEGFVALTMNVFPYPVPLDAKERQSAYDKYNEALGTRYCNYDADDREKYFFRAAYLGIDRAVDWLAEQDFVDADRIGFYGSSQGGASALILGGLNKHFCAILSAVPALCDHNGFLKGRSPGWPRLVDANGGKESVREASRYLDAVNFARRINVPITITVGFIDVVCSPSSVYSAYNVIPSENKQILHEPELGHQNKDKFSNAFKELRQSLKEKTK